MQAAGGDSMGDRTRAEAKPDELLPPDDPVLFVGKPPNLATKPHRSFTYRCHTPYK
jgi:hypothetical protein